MEVGSRWPGPEFEGTGSGDKDSDTLTARLGSKAIPRSGKERGAKSLFNRQTASK